MYVHVGGCSRRGLYLCNLDDPQRTTRVTSSSNKWEASEVKWNPHYSHRAYVASAVCSIQNGKRTSATIQQSSFHCPVGSLERFPLLRGFPHRVMFPLKPLKYFYVIFPLSNFPSLASQVRDFPHLRNCPSQASRVRDSPHLSNFTSFSLSCT